MTANASQSQSRANLRPHSRIMHHHRLSRMPPRYARGFIFGILFNILHFFYHLFVLSVVVIGLSMFWLPIIAEYKYAIELEISDYLGAPVSIEAVLFDPQHNKPYWILKNIRLKDPSARITLMHLDELSLSLDPIESLRTIRFQPDKITAKGGYFSVVQDEEGVFRVDGLKLPLRGFNSGAGRNTGLVFDFQDVDINWLNEKTYQQLIFANTRLHGAITPLEIIANMTLLPPADVGLPIQLKTHLFYRGDDQKTPVSTDKLQWDGKFQLSGELNKLDALPIDLVNISGLKNAHLALDGEGIVTEGALSSLHGNLLLSDVTWLDESKTNAAIGITGQWLSLPSGWKIDASLNDIRSIDSQHSSSLDHSNIFLESRYDELQQQHINMDVDFINLSHYFPILEKQAWLKGDLRNHLSQLKPRGQLNDLKAKVVLDADNKLLDLLGRGQIGHFGISESANLPGIQNLNLAFEATEHSGKVTFAIQDSELIYSKLFNKPIPITQSSGVLSLSRQNQQWAYQLDDFVFDNDDLKADGYAHIDYPDQGALPADMALSFKTKRIIRNIQDYIPNLLSGSGKEWTDMALIEGYVPSGEFKLKGNLKDTPFEKNKTGDFYVGFNVERSKLKPLPEWPMVHDLEGKVEFIDGQMRASVKSGKIEDARFIGGDIGINTFKKGGHIDVEQLSIQSKLSTIENVIADSPIGQGTRGFFDNTDFDGQGLLQLDVRSAFNEHIRTREGIDIKAVLDTENGAIKFPHIDQAIENIQASIEFDNDGITIPKATVIYKGKPASIEAETIENGRYILINLAQNNNFKRLFPSSSIKSKVLNDRLSLLLSGDFPYTASIKVPSYSKRAKSVEKQALLSVKSDLKGLHSRLPTPLFKASQQSIPFLLDARFPFENEDKPSNSHFTIKYGQRLHAQLQTNPKRLAVHFGHQAADLPASGIKLSGAPGQFDLLAWERVIKGIGDALAKADYSEPSIPLSINLMIDRLLLGKTVIGRSSISGDVSDSQGKLTLKAGEMRVSIDIKPQQLDIAALGVDFDLLTAASATQKAKTTVNAKKRSELPTKYPSIYFTCDQCKFKNMLLDRVVFDMPKQGHDALIKQFNVESDYLSLQARGHWKAYNQNQESQSYLVIDSIDIPRPDSLLSKLGHDLGIKGARTSMNGQLQWHDSPFTFALSKLSGELYVNVNQGAIPQLDPGAGKLLGLLNFSHLGKRLQLNFRDLPAEGVGFDSIIGNLQFDQGKLRSDDIILKSSVMLAGIKGEADLVTKTHDHHVTVIPDIKSALPVVGVLFGGIGIGAAVAMLDQITDGDEEKQLQNENVGMRYHISGSWDNPQVDEVQAISNDDFLSEDDFDDF